MSTNVRVSDDTHSRLKDIRPYDSMSFDELIREMAEQYDPPLEAR